MKISGGVFAKALTSRVTRIASQLGFILLAALFLFVSAYRLTQIWLVPEVTIAVPDSQYNSLFSQLAEIADPALLTIRVRSFGNSAAVADALNKGEADFAVVPTDKTFPKTALSTAVLSEEPLLFIRFENTTARKGKEQKKADRALVEDPREGLKCLRIGVNRDLEILNSTVSAFVSASNITVIKLDTADLRRVLAETEVDCVAVMGSLEMVKKQLSQVADLKPELLSVNPIALETTLPHLEKFAVPAHTFSKTLPPEEINTVAVSWRLVARKETERAAVAAVLQSLFASRLQLAQGNATAWQIKGFPDEGSTSSKYPIHRGALDYYNREQQTFMDLYGDWLWLALFAAGGLSSGLAWLIQTVFRRRQRLVESILDRLLEILTEAREAKDEKRLEELTREVDGLVTHAVRQARWRASNPISTTALTLAIDSSRHAISDRQRYISKTQH